MTTITAIVFDMDDTLYPESAYVLSGFRAVSDWFEGEYAIPTDTSYTILKSLFDKGIRGNNFNLWLEALDVEPEANLIQNCVRVYRDHHPILSPYDDVIPILNVLKPDHKIGLLSDGYLSVQQKKFNALGLSEFFDATVFSDEFGRDAWKPSIIPFQHILDRLGVEAHQAVYIGDNPKKDFFGANQLGMKTVWIRRSHGEYVNQPLPGQAYEPHETITTLAQIETLSSKFYTQK